MSNKFLAIFRKAEDAQLPVRRPPPPVTVKLEPVAAPRPKLCFAFDATASREAAWATSIPLTDALLAALPGQLDVALAVHGGGKLHTFTRFESDAGKLRDRAAGVRCRSGYTALLPIARVLETGGVSTIVYVGDTFEESEPRARKLAAALAAGGGTRIIILHDTSSSTTGGAEIFAEMAAITSGAVLPFDPTALPKLRELLEAVAVLAVGDVPMLRARQETMPAARLLLQHLGKGKP